jgi:Tfp pilus assembly protein PilE
MNLKKSPGFTLFHLLAAMIVVAVLGIIVLNRLCC